MNILWIDLDTLTFESSFENSPNVLKQKILNDVDDLVKSIAPFCRKKYEIFSKTALNQMYEDYFKDRSIHTLLKIIKFLIN